MPVGAGAARCGRCGGRSSPARSGSSKLMTWVMPSMSMPRAAMSVATSTRVRRRGSRPAPARAAPWRLLPWMASAPMPALVQLAARRLSAPCLVRVKTSARPMRLVAQQLRQQRALLGLARRSSTCCSTRLDRRGDGGHRRPAPGRCSMLSASERDLAAAWWRRTAASAASSGSRGDDAPDVADEAHVEHAVGLVEDEDLDARRARHGPGS